MKGSARHTGFGRIVLAVAAITVLMVVANYTILYTNNLNNAEKSGEMLLDQTCGVLNRNADAEETLIESLKEEYMIRANAVAYMIDNNPAAEYDIDELCKMAWLMNIDEIHLFDENGTIYSGTEPKYFGLNFGAGEQIKYFLPMLEDKSLSMCQDVVPNTAEGKEMMYAITWNSSGDKMIQVGIEPVRLLAELKNNEVSNVVASMPVYDDLEIFVADAQGSNVLASTAKKSDSLLSGIAAKLPDMQRDEVYTLRAEVDGADSVCTVVRQDKYIIGVVQSVSQIKAKTVLPVLLIMLCLIIAAIPLLAVSRYMLIIRREQTEQLEILTSMSGIYYSMHLLDLCTNTLTEFSAHGVVKEVVAKHDANDASNTVREVMHATMSDDYLERSLEFTDLSTMTERLNGKKVISMDLLGRNVGWIRMSFITISRDKLGRAEKVICTTQIIDEEKRREELLMQQSTTDRLTGCFNRREYENDLIRYVGSTIEDDFVFVSMDVNGLKSVNDALGHAAGDELLVGASQCMQQCFGTYGKVFRLGGDEFVAMIFADDNKLREIRQDFEETLSGWKGELVGSLSVSSGYVPHREFTDLSLSELAKIADRRMYEAKDQYYRETGRERLRR